MKTYKFKRSQCALAVTLSLACATPAFAQESSNEEDVETITIRVTKRNQTLQDIPYNISAVNGATMEKAGIDDMAKLGRVVPGLIISDKGTRSSGTFAGNTNIRGMNIDGNALSSESPGITAPTVATYIGNVPLFVGLRLKDIEQVEVLRGPQGTLYGSGAMGGIIRIQQTKAQVGYNSASVSTAFSNTAGDAFNWEIDTIANIAIGDDAALRLNFGKVERDGFIDQTNLFQLNSAGNPVFDETNGATDLGSRVTKEDVNDESITNARASFVWEFADDASMELSYLTQSDDVGGRQGDSSEQAGYDEYELSNVLDEPYEREVDLLALDIEMDVGFATFTSSTSSSKMTGELVVDSTGEYETVVAAALGDDCSEWCSITGEPTTYFQYYYGNNPRFIMHSNRAFSDESFTQEFRLSSNNDSDKVFWIVGGYYQKQETNLNQTDTNIGRDDYANAGGFLEFALPNFSDPADFPNRDTAYFFENDSTFTDKSIFGELTYYFAPEWQVTGGLRYFQQEYEATQTGGLVFADLIEANTRTIKDNDVLIKLNTSYDINDDMMMFATYSEGFRRGGVNALPATVFDEAVDEALFEYQADTVKNKEIGIKGQTENGTNYTATVFEIDWNNPQVNTLLTDLVLVGAISGGKSKNRGVEFELKGELTDSISYALGYTFIDAEIVQGDAAGLVASTGDRLPTVPDHSLSLSLDYLTEHGDWNATYNMSMSYQSDTVNATLPENNESVRTQFREYDAFTTVDLTAMYEIDEWAVRVFVNNLTDERGSVGGLTLLGGGPQGQHETIIRPRTIGVSATYKWEL